jgi:DNA polymerase-3 subunit alpha
MIPSKLTEFVHLELHSEYSIVDGMVRLGDAVERAAQFGMPALAVTDLMNLFGLVKFYKKAISHGVKPIIGAELVISTDDADFTCTVLCLNQAGYHELTCLLSDAYLQQARPLRVRYENFLSNSQNLLVLVGQSSDVGQAVIENQIALAKTRIQTWQQHFPNRFYVVVTRTQQRDELSYFNAVLALVRDNPFPVVATNSIRFLSRDDFEAHEARVCIHAGYVLDDPARPKRYTEHQYMRSTEEMRALFHDLPVAIAQSVEISRRCTVPLVLDQVFLPRFPIPSGDNLEAYFRRAAEAGLSERLNKMNRMGQKRQHSDDAYHARLALELQVIINMGFPGYFLIVADFIAWAKSQNIPVGPGRGSGAGSLVAYVLGITELDPLQHDLLFERFLNPERVSMPDFDIDFCMEGRDRVIEYVAQRYGSDKVAQIITYGTMAAKAVVRDVGRVLGHPYGFVDKIAKLVPFEIGMTLQKALTEEEALKARYEQEEDVQTLIDLAKKLEGVTRNAGKHAGGVVIAPTALTDFVPLYCEADSPQAVTQFDKDDVEAVGLVKFDFLGLRTLTIIHWALETINKKRRAEVLPEIDIQEIPLNDQEAFNLLKRCKTTAVFQLESRGMKELIRRLQPDCFDDITALVALFRPGPLQSGMVDDFIDRKHGRAAVVYPHPDLEPILRPTYGVILYQEQVMQIAQVLAGYTLGGADILRRAMGKKKPEEMAKQREVFTSGASGRGIDPNLATAIFDLMEKFAGYGFNKSHSAAYALIAYQTAYLKAHYPAEFMAAVLSSDMDNTDKVVGFVKECRDMGLIIRVPAVNEGDYHFTVNPQGEIIYGLGAIKGVGESVIRHLVELRQLSGPFVSLFDLCQRADARKITRRALEPLIKSGACDAFGVSRAQMMANVESALKYASMQHRNCEQGQADLFSLDTTVRDHKVDQIEQTNIPDWPDLVRLNAEKETLGYYLSGHPMQSCEKELAHLVKRPIRELAAAMQNNTIVAGILVGMRQIMTKTGKKMAIMTLEDRTGRLDVTLFSDVYQKVAGRLVTGEIYLVKGNVAKDDYTDGIRVTADAVMSLEETRVKMVRELKIHVRSQEQMNKLVAELPPLIKTSTSGRCPIKLIVKRDDTSAELQLGEAWRVSPTRVFLESLYTLCGHENVVLDYLG